MNTLFPDYYNDFKCIASQCKHTCCAGWEIDIDEYSLERFRKYPDITSHIKDGSFILESNENCPFLREDGLCQMILDHGEDILCDICREHPRFYNDCEDHIEAGIGLVCEEACRLVLDKDEDFKLIPEGELSDEIKIVFDSSLSLTDRLSKLKDSIMDPVSRATYINTLEVLDPSWTDLINKIISNPPSSDDEMKLINQNERKFSNFSAYLLYRYPYETGFAVESTYLLADLVLTGTDIHEAARMFSGEIEYSDINIDNAIEEFAF